MRTRRFGRTGADIGIIGQGTWNLENGDRSEISEAIHRGLELGMNHIDTAEMYGNGQVERVLADVLQDARDRVFLVSKVLPQNATYEGTIAACEGSLDRLETDRLDCYLLHWHEGPPVEETFRAFEKLEADGKILSWGVSNFELHEMKAAIELVGEGRIACNQIEYFLQNRKIEKELIGYCAEHDVPIVAYSPFGDTRFPDPATEQGKLLDRIGKDLGGVSPRCVALAYLLRHDDMFAIPKAAKTKHVEDNAIAASLELSPAILHEIGTAFPIA